MKFIYSEKMKKKKPCWKGYEMVGTKEKNGREVPNCVPKKESEAYFDIVKEAKKAPAWQRSEGKNEEGGLNQKGRDSYNKETGGNLKPPVSKEEAEKSEGKSKRRDSFCARMCGHKKKNTGTETKNDPESRVNKALRKWDCRCK